MPSTPDAPLDLDGPIWRFALAFYGTPGIAQACLALQDEMDLDVIALIAILYAYAVLDRPMDDEEVAGLCASMAGWRKETVLPLRGLRRRLKTPPDGFPAVESELLRELIKKAELKAEQIQLALAERWITRQKAAVPGLPPEIAVQRLTAGQDTPPDTFKLLIAAAHAAGRDV